MLLKTESKPSRPAMWTSRVALFSAGLVLTTLALHRLFWMPTPVALNLFTVAYAGALVSILLALAGLVVTWRKGTPGVSRVMFALVVSLGMLAWPASLVPAFVALPMLNDVTTDVQSPPPFPTLADARAKGRGNTGTYPRPFAELQAKAYPDIGPFLVDRSVEETYELVVATLQKMKMRIVHEELPNPRAEEPGLVEATDRTLILGFIDDVVMRVSVVDQRRSRVDIRSSSRYGRHDLGRNALRVRAIAKELATRIEATVPIQVDSGPRISTMVPQKRDIKGKIDKLVPKRLKVRDPTIIAPQPVQAPDHADARRAPAPKGKQRPQDERRGRDKQRRQPSE